MTESHCCNSAGQAHHHHAHQGSSVVRLGWALAIIASFAVVEIIGGLLSGSLALLADAGHMVTDAAALALALSAQWISKRPETDRFPFGLKRAQVLAAFVNGLALLLVVGFLVLEAISRISAPQEIDAGLMLTVAAVGLAANILAFFILHPQADENVNVRGAMLHVAADIFGSVAAILSALVIMATGFFAVDALLTLAVCVLILRSTIPLLSETSRILLQGAPEGLDCGGVAEEIIRSTAVEGVHQMRAWQLTPDETLMAMHAVVPADADPEATLAQIKKILREKCGIEQSTVQLEFSSTPPSLASYKGCSDELQQAAE